MKDNYSIVLAILLSVLVIGAASAVADGKEDKKYLTGKVDEKSLEEFKEKGCKIVKKHSKIASLRCPEAVANELNLREDIKVYAFDIIADRQIGADAVWNLGYTGANRLVSVLDTGINYNHLELTDSYAGGWNFIADNNNPFDDNGHGTHVSGIIASNGNDMNSKGVAPDAKMLAFKVLDSSGSGSFSDVIAAIYRTVDGPDEIYGTSDDYNTDVISMSLGSGSPFLYTGSNCDSAYPEMTDAVNYAVSKGVAVVAASGNSGTRGVSIPACISSAVAVGAVGSTDVRASFSGAGYSLDIMAPGVSIYSTWPSGYSTLSGTSMATPHVSGVVALLKQANNGLSVSAVKNALYTTAKDLGTAGYDPYYGSGRVNALAAVNSVLPPAIIHDVSVSSISAPASVTNGSVAAISVAVKNEGNQPETFTVNVTDITDSAAIGSMTASLSAGASQSLSFNFDTSSSSIGSHTIKAEAVAVSGETDTSDNVKTTSIEIKELLHDIAVSSISAPSSVAKGSAAAISVAVKNEGNQPETFTVNVTDITDSATIGSMTASLSAGASQSLSFNFDTSSSSIGSHTIKAEAVAVSGETDTSDNVKTTSIAVVVQPEMHIKSITMTAQRWGDRTRAVATVTVVNETGYSVSGADVHGRWSGLTSDSDVGATDSTGKVILYSDWKKKAKGTFTFAVSNLVKSGWKYNSTANVLISNSITV